MKRAKKNQTTDRQKDLFKAYGINRFYSPGTVIVARDDVLSPLGVTKLLPILKTKKAKTIRKPLPHLARRLCSECHGRSYRFFAWLRKTNKVPRVQSTKYKQYASKFDDFEVTGSQIKPGTACLVLERPKKVFGRQARLSQPRIATSYLLKLLVNDEILYIYMSVKQKPKSIWKKLPRSK